MFTINDFIKLMKYFKGETVSDLDGNLIIQAEDSKAKTQVLFSDNIDLNCHMSEDYKRLKNFLVPWYASLRTLSSTMKQASDVRSLPDEHLNELIKSFGFVDSLENIMQSNKIDFFYDLVNLYKIKGTQESVERALGYFGIANIELMEYWLQYNSNRELVFRPVRLSTQSGSLINLDALDIDYDIITSADPHWFLTKDKINQLFLNNKIAFPSKTPYFGIRPITELSGNIINPSLEILSRIVQNSYVDYMNGNSPPKDTKTTTINILVSILDLYLGCVYTFNSLYPKSTYSNDTSDLIYNGSMSLSNENIFDLYDTLMKRSSNQTRSQLAFNQEQFVTYFTRLRTLNFLTSLNTAGDLLTTLNPSLKRVIDDNLGINNGEYTLRLLVKDLSSWIKDHISIYAPDLSVLAFGSISLDYVIDIINFFKPYRARLISVEHIYTIKNPALDSVIADDLLNEKIKEIVVDFDTADSIPSYPEDFIPEDYIITTTPPTNLSKKIINLYKDTFDQIKCEYDNSTLYTGVTSDIYSAPPIGNYRITNLYINVSEDGSIQLYSQTEIVPESIADIKTKIISTPPLSFYKINDMYIEGGLLRISYTSDQSISEANIEKKYYSRLMYDTGSYFDIGASNDIPPEVDYKIDVDQIQIEKYNYHNCDCTSTSVIYYVDSTSNDIVEVFSAGGWPTFDTGMLFDNPAICDVCNIKVFDSVSINDSSNDGTVGIDVEYISNEVVELGTIPSS